MKHFFMLICFATLVCGCEKAGIKHPCYDEELKKNTAGCTLDCPGGFIGCDGQEYCSECQAAMEGIGPQ